MSRPSSLIVKAGPKALATIRRDGFRPEQVAVIPGAAGGPKALVIIGLDRAIFGEWLPRATRVRDLIGVSIGAWQDHRTKEDKGARVNCFENDGGSERSNRPGAANRAEVSQKKSIVNQPISCSDLREQYIANHVK